MIYILCKIIVQNYNSYDCKAFQREVLFITLLNTKVVKLKTNQQQDDFVVNIYAVFNLWKLKFWSDIADKEMSGDHHGITLQEPQLI